MSPCDHDRAVVPRPLPVVVSAASAPPGFEKRATHTSPNVFAEPAGSSELSEPKNARPWPSQAITGSPALAVRACESAAYGEVSSGIARDERALQARARRSPSGSHLSHASRPQQQRRSPVTQPRSPCVCMYVGPRAHPRRFRDLFLLDPSVIFLNHGSFGAVPRPVFDEQERLRREMEAEPVLFLARNLDERLRAVRDAIAGLVGAASPTISASSRTPPPGSTPSPARSISGPATRSSSRATSTARCGCSGTRSPALPGRRCASPRCPSPL